jgi:DNA repair protein RadC
MLISTPYQPAQTSSGQTAFDPAIIPVPPPSEALVCEGRVSTLGARALSDAELIALVLGEGGRGESSLALARRLLADAGSLHRLLSWQEADFRARAGIGRARAWRLIAVLEAGRRALSEPMPEAPLLNRADLVAEYLRPLTVGLEVEVFWTLCLNRKGRLLKRVEVTSGTATATLAHPREVFRPAIRESATAVVVAHSHPSGDPAPSRNDLEITHLLRAAAKTIEIGFQDHIIVGRASADPLGRGFYSFLNAGLI